MKLKEVIAVLHPRHRDGHDADAPRFDSAAKSGPAVLLPEHLRLVVGGFAPVGGWAESALIPTGGWDS